MSPLELAILNVSEVAVRELHEQNDSRGFKDLRKDAIKGGEFGSKTMKNLEETMGRSIITSKNYLPSNK